MLMQTKKILKMNILGTDEDIGTIQDLLFDDESWTVRYLIVKTGGWFSGDEFVISPYAISNIDLEHGKITTNLSRAQIESCPRASDASYKPVSRQEKEQLHSHFGWPNYWHSSIHPAPGMYTFPLASTPLFADRINDEGMSQNSALAKEVQERQRQDFNPHLRSFKEVEGYSIEASDGDIGEVDDLLIDSDAWQITHFVADTKKWWPGKHVVIDRGSVEGISWESRGIIVMMTRQQVKDAPEYNKENMISERYQRDISQYYRGIDLDNVRRDWGRREPTQPHESL